MKKKKKLFHAIVRVVAKRKCNQPPAVQAKLIAFTSPPSDSYTLVTLTSQL